MHHEERGRETEDEPEELSDEGVRLIRGRDDDAGDRRLDERQDRERHARQDRERQHDEDLLDEHPATDGWRRDRRVDRRSIRAWLHPSHCTHRLDFGLLDAEGRDAEPRHRRSRRRRRGHDRWVGVGLREGARRGTRRGPREGRSRPGRVLARGRHRPSAGRDAGDGGPRDVVDRLLPITAGALRDRQRFPRARLPDPRDG